MKIAGIDFPSPLLSALRDGELVIFAGAGISMGEPACLPSFKQLAEKIAQGTDKRLQDRESEDHFLGRLHNEGVKVHKLAVRVLSRNNPKPTDLHRNLLRLYQKDGEKVRVVTTNFDLLFEEGGTSRLRRCARGVSGTSIAARSRFQWNRSHSWRSRASTRDGAHQ